MNYLLIDYENIQSLDLAPFDHPDTIIIVFVGANQTKIPFEVAAALQDLGERARYIKVTGVGHNALDFHIAFLVTHDPDASFSIVSRDAGFDPLIEHLTARSMSVQRIHDVASFQEPDD